MTPQKELTQKTRSKTKGEPEKRQKRTHQDKKVDQRGREANTIGNRESQLSDALEFQKKGNFFMRNKSAGFKQKSYQTEDEEMHSYHKSQISDISEIPAIKRIQTIFDTDKPRQK